MRMGGGAFPEISASAPCTQNASLAQSGKSLVVASVRGALGIAAVARQMRWLFGPRGGAARQHVLAAAGADAISNHNCCAAWAAYRKARKKGEKRKVGDGGQR